MKSNIKIYWESHKFQYYNISYILQFLISMHRKESVMSYTTIARYMKRTLGLSFKRISNHPPKILSQDIKAKCSDYAKFIRLCDQSKVKVIQIDEFTIGRGIIPKMAWAEREKYVFRIHTQSYGQFSVIIAISNINVDLFHISDSNTNRNIFLVFMKLFPTKIDERYEGVKKKVILTMDDARYHRYSKFSSIELSTLSWLFRLPIYARVLPCRTLHQHYEE